VRKIKADQGELFDRSEYAGSDSGTWGWCDPDHNELGTKKKLVPNAALPEVTQQLGTKKSLVPNADEDDELGTKKFLVPNAQIWKPPIGCLNQKWVKSDRYWYWSYYKSKGKKGSLYLAKDYNEAIAKAKKIGMPPNAKPPKLRATPPEH
jgi:hypothetical protein